MYGFLYTTPHHTRPEPQLPRTADAPDNKLPGIPPYNGNRSFTSRDIHIFNLRNKTSDSSLYIYWLEQ